MWRQAELKLAPRPRGVHLVTEEVLRQVRLQGVRVGLLHLHLLHTSASLALNENASPDVRRDLERFLRKLVPDGTPYFEHTQEGQDDMPAHAKAVLVGPSLTLPIADGRLRLGTWQGIYLCEHRELPSAAGARRVVATVWGEARGE